MKNSKIVTFLLLDGTKQVTEVTNTDSKVLSDIKHDLKAVTYSFEGIESNKPVKEISFTKQEKNNARKDYKDIQKANPQGFAKNLEKFRAEVVDKLSKAKLRFNLVSLKFSN